MRVLFLLSPLPSKHHHPQWVGLPISMYVIKITSPDLPIDQQSRQPLIGTLFWVILGCMKLIIKTNYCNIQSQVSHSGIFMHMYHIFCSHSSSASASPAPLCVFFSLFSQTVLSSVFMLHTFHYLLLPPPTASDVFLPSQRPLSNPLSHTNLNLDFTCQRKHGKLVYIQLIPLSRVISSSSHSPADVIISFLFTVE